LNWYGRLSASRREEIAAYLFIAPWLFGFVVFQFGAVTTSFILSFLKVDFLTEWQFIGLQNYQQLAGDAFFWKALWNTAYYALGRMPLVLVVGLSIALLLNKERPGSRFFITAFYLPSVTSGAAAALLWIWIFNQDYGLINSGLKLLGLQGPRWLNSEEWAMPSLILISLWGVGSSVVIYLASLRGVPPSLYEAASLDGAGPIRQFFRITVPMITPAILYNFVVGIIASFQVFLNSYVITGGGPNNATLTLVLYLYRKAFQEFMMGYASAIGWVLFVIILLFTLIVFKSSSMWVYYEAELKKGR
jgi:multiple sugar transport system permease protein